MATAKNLSASQQSVLRMACTHGHLTQGCVQQADYGARQNTIYSLKRRGLLDCMNRPTEKGQKIYEEQLKKG